MSFPILQPAPRHASLPLFLHSDRFPSPLSSTESISTSPAPDSPSSVGATVASSDRSATSSPFDSSHATPRPTSPDYRSPTGHASVDLVGSTAQPARSLRPPYVPPHRRPGPELPPRIPFAFRAGLGSELDHLALRDTFTKPGPASHSTPAVIKHVRVSGGYKWIDPPNGLSGPTIVVPGAPDIWVGRDRTDGRIKRDAELAGNIEFPDYNRENMPAGYDPLDLIFNSLKLPLELRGVQIMTGRNNFKKLFSFCCGRKRYSDFRLDARVIPGSQLVMLSRWELPPQRRGREPTNWHLSFHEQNTVTLYDGSDRTPGYHRILRYNFGGLEVMIKSDVAAAFPWDGCAPDDVAGQSGSRTDGGEDEKKDQDDMMSLDSFSIYPKSTSGGKDLADVVFSGPPRVLSSGITLIRTPFPHPPQGHLISLKTRSVYAGEPRGLRHFYHAPDAFSMVYFGQIANLYLAHHCRGEFEPGLTEYRLGHGVLAEMEREYADTIRVLRDVLRWVHGCAIKYGSVGVVFSGGVVRCLEKTEGSDEEALSKEAWDVIRQSGI